MALPIISKGQITPAQACLQKAALNQPWVARSTLIVSVMATPHQTMYPSPMELELFTILCEFKGGTYISQVQAVDAAHAMVNWANLLRLEQSIEVASDHIAHAATDTHDNLVPLTGVTGVWCWITTIDDDLVLANIVRSAWS